MVTGFVAATVEGTPTTLKRSGSDYSATIFARLMGASRITMWKNVDGVYTADPRRVPEVRRSLPHVSLPTPAPPGLPSTPLSQFQTEEKGHRHGRKRVIAMGSTVKLSVSGPVSG